MFNPRGAAFIGEPRATIGFAGLPTARVSLGLAAVFGHIFTRGCYGLGPSTVIARCRKRQAKATKCSPATVSGNRS